MKKHITFILLKRGIKGWKNLHLQIYYVKTTRNNFIADNILFAGHCKALALCLAKQEHTSNFFVGVCSLVGQSFITLYPGLTGCNKIKKQVRKFFIWGVLLKVFCRFVDQCEKKT